MGFSTGSYYIILDLKMFEYQEAQAEDIRFSILYGLILLVVGSASFYFLLLAQNYYVTNHTLKTMESYTQNILESMPNGLISLDNEGKIESINHNALQLLKLDSDKIKGKKIDVVLQNCKLPEPSLLDNNILQKQIECQLNDNSVIPLNITVSKLNNGLGEKIGLVIILSDLRDIRSLEKQILRSERLASLGRMAAGIAHEIRNPLSSIKGFVQYFRNKFPDNSRDRAYASVVVNEVDRLNRVIQDMLNFAKPKEPKLEKIILQDVIDHSLKLMKPDISGNAIEVSTNYSETSPIYIFGDFDMLTQVFLNLLLNAIDAMKTNGKLSISIFRKAEITNVIMTDNGEGIPDKNIRKIFDPFYTSKKEGAGLGLAIVHRIIESHEGEISVESIPGSTIFRITFKTSRKY
ncbi:MAG: ATP-binding protein [Spirochaetales bacterium]|nr:ATP-binding protein [Spirochaetales bacterium]